MPRVVALLGVIGAFFWYLTMGAGGNGRSPYGTAAAFARTISMEPGECAERMEKMFPDVSAARGLCGGELSEAFRHTRKTYITERSKFEATAICFYGAT
ncbi:MAG: hypothetical protein JST93_16845 [Acidobacteria bacterium]|nr:hypothetical protein [Acidobacteriota bacterium]